MKKWLLPAIFIIVASLMSILSYPYLPDQVPIHWNAYGEPDNYASKTFALFFMPIIMVFIYVLIRLVRNIDPKKKNIQKFSKEVDTVMNATLLVMIIVHGMTILYGMGREIDMSMAGPGLVGMLFVIIGNYMPRFKFNYFIGIRTPWTLANEKVWTRTHQWGGRIFVIGGLMLILTAFLPTSWKLYALILVVLTVVLIPTLYSFNLYRKQQGQS